MELLNLKANKDSLGDNSQECKKDPGADLDADAPPGEDNEKQDRYYNGTCGLFGCNPKWLQFFNNPLVFLFSLCYFAVIQGSIATGFISVGLSSIERRYNLPSALSAFAAISYEIGVIITLPFSSYFGGRSHKPRVLGISLLTMGIGSLIFASPQYFSGSYNVNTNFSSEICANTSTFQPQCNAPLIFFYPLFILGNIIIGIGASALYTVGIGFLDESTHPRYTPIYLSIFHIVAIVGPAVGFALGGLFLSLFVDPFTATTLTSTHPQWVGAWWIGFVISGIAAIFGSLHFFLYPRRLKGSKAYDILRHSQQPVLNDGISFENDHSISILVMVKECPLYVCRLLKNVTFLFTTLGVTSGAFIIAGIVTFLPKFVEVQFNITASLASYVIGAISIPSASIGILLGGITLVIFKKITVEKLALCVFILTIIEIFIPPLFLLGCSAPKIAGTNFDYPNSTARTNFILRSLNVSCLSACDCKTNTYQPICSESVIYFSPCLAGCPNEPNSNGSYAGCSCLEPGIIASDGKCEGNCIIRLIIAALLLFFAVTIIFYNTIPFIKLTLRCVADKDRTIALGLQSLIIRALGQLPGPLVIGAIFDLNCILWEETECGDRGSCLEYNPETLRYSLIGLMAIGLIASAIFFFLAWITWRCKKMQEKEIKY